MWKIIKGIDSPEWEYYRVSGNSFDEATTGMSEAGMAGWELVGVWPEEERRFTWQGVSAKMSKWNAVYKRPRAVDPENVNYEWSHEEEDEEKS